MLDKTKTGLYHKFDVRRTDGSDAPGCKHDGCSYYVLDLTHDKHALPALKAYADSCRDEYPLLARDLDTVVDGNPLAAERRPVEQETTPNDDDFTRQSSASEAPSMGISAKEPQPKGSKP